jgi:hypothetical protein
VPENIDSPVVCRIGAIELDGQILIRGYPPRVTSTKASRSSGRQENFIEFALLDQDAAREANAASSEF